MSNDFYAILRVILADTGIYLNDFSLPHEMEAIELDPLSLPGIKNRLALTLGLPFLDIGNSRSMTALELLVKLECYYGSKPVNKK